MRGVLGGWRGEQRCMGGQPSLPALVPSDMWSQTSSLCYSNAMRGGVEGGDMGTCCCPQQFFLPSLQLHEKPMTLLGFALQHDLLGFGISPSHHLLPKSRQSWMGEPRFFSSSPRISAWTGHRSSPPQNRGHYRDRGLTEIHPTKTELLGPDPFQNPPEWALQILSLKAFACSGFSLARAPFADST